MRDTVTNTDVERRVRENAHKEIILVHPSLRATFSLFYNTCKKKFTMKYSIVHSYNQEHPLHPKDQYHCLIFKLAPYKLKF